MVVILSGAGWLYYSRTGEIKVPPYRFVTVEQGDLESVVSSTGTLEAVTTVQVGTQVSGIISAIFADFNDHVRQGQVIALIDTTLLASTVRDAKANLERSQAQLAQAEREFNRIQKLYEKEFTTEVEFNLAKYNLDIARATMKSSEVNLERARRNLEYATIRAPISGVVVERNVDVGQTVAASFSAPQLFLIAKDLSQLQILAAVDESDIGLIHEGQEARFTVQAFDDRTFEGTVRQVRLQSRVQENVVNYTVVVDVSNKDGSLLPGMTATVDFLIERATDVLKVPNAALRFRPTEAMMAELRARREQRLGDTPDSLQGRGGRRAGGGEGTDRGFGIPGGFGVGAGNGGGRNGAFGAGRSDFVMLWYLDEEGRLSVAPARRGITDGQMTEIRGRNLKSGMHIIVGVNRTGETEAAASPFQGQQQGGSRFRGGF